MGEFGFPMPEKEPEAHRLTLTGSLRREYCVGAVRAFHIQFWSVRRLARAVQPNYPFVWQPLPPLAREYSRVCDRWDSSRIWGISLI